MLTSAILDWLLHSEGGKSNWLEFWDSYILPSLQTHGVPLRHSSRHHFPANVRSILGFFASVPCVQRSNADHPPIRRIFKASTFTRQETNMPFDLHHCASSAKHSTVIFNAKKALITSENTAHPYSTLFKQQSLEFHFLQTGTQKPAR